jgi:hypothetical protein
MRRLSTASAAASHFNEKLWEIEGTGGKGKAEGTVEDPRVRPTRLFPSAGGPLLGVENPLQREGGLR